MNKLKTFLDSDYFLMVLLAILGLFNFGWIFFPILGQIWMAINAGIVILAAVYLLLRSIYHKLKSNV